MYTVVTMIDCDEVLTPKIVETVVFFYHYSSIFYMELEGCEFRL